MPALHPVPPPAGPLNRGLILIDGDNITAMFRELGLRPSLDRLRDWMGVPTNLGLDQIVGFVHFASLADLQAGQYRRSIWATIPYTKRDDVVLSLHRIREGHGYPDAAVFREALRRRTDYDTLVLVSGDHDYMNLGLEIRAGYNRFTGQYDPKMAREVVIVASSWNAPLEWWHWADNYVELDTILPELGDVDASHSDSPPLAQAS